jgi:hypothetical protein
LNGANPLELLILELSANSVNGICGTQLFWSGDTTEHRELRGEVRILIVRRVEKRIDEYKLDESHVTRLLEAAKSFFCDSDLIWPLHYSAYYLGHVPKLDSLVSVEAFTSTMTRTHFLHNVHGDFHLAGIRLASRIWGMVQKDMARRRQGIAVDGLRL